jgi:iron complex transport system permease protein
MKLFSQSQESVGNRNQTHLMIKITLIALPVIAFIISFCFGRYGVSPQTVIEILWSNAFGTTGNYDSIDNSVVMVMRFPRILMCLMVGAGLSMSGAALQGMFGNPLVSPQILGVSAGAGFGAALAILISGSVFLIQSMALLFGICAVALTYTISRIKGSNSSVYILVLAGVITSAFFEALISTIKFVADPFSKLPTITYWLMEPRH